MKGQRCGQLARTNLANVLTMSIDRKFQDRRSIAWFGDSCEILRFDVHLMAWIKQMWAMCCGCTLASVMYYCVYLCIVVTGNLVISPSGRSVRIERLFIMWMVLLHRLLCGMNMEGWRGDKYKGKKSSFSSFCLGTEYRFIKVAIVQCEFTNNIL